MNKYNFDEINNRRNTNSVKWDVKDNELPMWVADMDFKVLPEIKDAIKKRSELDSYGYIDIPKEYFSSYRYWYKNRHGLDIKEDEMVYVSGVVAGIDSIFKHLLHKGDGVIVMTPIYHIFYNCIRNNGLKQFDNEFIYQSGKYEIDFEGLENLAKKDEVKALLLCNPHNPIGRLFSSEELTKIAKICENYGVFIISDEIHGDIVKPGKDYVSILKVSDKAVALVSPSKTFNMAGLQAACIFVKDQKLKEKIETAVGQDDIGEPNYFSPFATIAAYTYGEKYVDELNEYIFNNKKYIQEYLKKYLPHLHLIDNDATYLLWLDISYYKMNGKEFANRLREETGLYVCNGNQFGKGGDSFIRINIATSLDNIKEACKRLQLFVSKLN